MINVFGNQHLPQESCCHSHRQRATDTGHFYLLNDHNELKEKYTQFNLTIKMKHLTK